MTGQRTAPARQARARTIAPESVRASAGPLLLADIDATDGLSGHRRRRGPVPKLGLDDVLARLETVDVRGRGGAGFPFLTKLRTAAAGRRRAEIVVNAAEGEPASAKDTALVLFAPHRVLDGAVAVAHALGQREITVVVPQERAATVEAMREALDERREAGERVRWRLHVIDPGFVSGQARSVIESISGRAALPVTAWTPEAVAGLRGRPTLLSNAETWAHVGAILADPQAYAALGTPTEPGTTLLTRPAPEDPCTAVVSEVEHGTPWEAVLGDALDRAVLLGGFHGTWVAPGGLAGMRVSRPELAAHGVALGAGVVLPLPDGSCPIGWTSGIVDYLAGESARRCGPCRNGLPAMADEVAWLAAGHSAASYARIGELAGLVAGRGACAHPDGTARLVRTMLTAFPDEVGEHLRGRCAW